MIICADDYGLTPQTNVSILDLAAAGKISSVSVMVRKLSSKDAAALLTYAEKIQIGLHLDLFTAWKEKNLRAEIRSQMNLFRQHFGFFPAHYDGHRHCHVYPLAGKALIECLQAQEAHPYYVRSLNMPEELKNTNSLKHRFYLKFLSFLNRRFTAQLRNAGIQTNPRIFGAFNAHQPTRLLFELSRRNAGPDDVFFCHPGVREDYDFLNTI